MDEIRRMFHWLYIRWLAWGPGSWQLRQDAFEVQKYDGKIMDALLKEPNIKPEYDQLKENPEWVRMMKNLLVTHGVYAQFERKYLLEQMARKLDEGRVGN